jgi:tetraacyldisaccharide 4'-kinase
MLYDIDVFKSYEFDVPVISVGNITVGGTGKTPMTEFLVKFLKNDYSPAVLSRGYKRKSKGFHVVNKDSDLKDVGDEPLQIKQKFPEVTVAVDGNRVRGIRKIMEHFPETSVILLDDAFQHRRVKPGFSIVLSDFGRSMKDDHFLPYGRLRESISELHRAHIIIITKTPESIKPIEMRITAENLNIKPYQTLYFSALKYRHLEAVFPGKQILRTLEDLKNDSATVLLITGIANPLPLIEFLSSKTQELIHLKYPDHHNFKEKDIQKIFKKYKAVKSPNKVIITTEKDALRLRAVEEYVSEEFKPHIYYIPISVKFISPPYEEFKEQMHHHIKTSTSNNKFFAARRDF